MANFCRHCGKQTLPTDKFCRSCGKRRASEQRNTDLPKRKTHGLPEREWNGKNAFNAQRKSNLQPDWLVPIIVLVITTLLVVVFMSRTSDRDKNVPPSASGEFQTSPSSTLPPNRASARIQKYPSTAVNIRSGPGTSYSITGKLEEDKPIEVSDLENGWYRVYKSGKPVGYASENYLLSKSAYTAHQSPQSVRASSVPGLFGVRLPEGSVLDVARGPAGIEYSYRQYLVPASYDALRTYFRAQMKVLGWSSYQAPTATSMFYKRGGHVLTIGFGLDGGSFILMVGNPFSP